MASLDEEFSTDQLPEPQSYDTIPAGWYSCLVSDAEVKRTNDGTGKYIKLRLDITGPRCGGRCVFTNINTNNKSDKAQEIGRQQLNSIMRSVGLSRLRDTDELLNKPMQIKVAIRRSEEYGDQNEVKAYKAIEGAGGGMPQQQSAPKASGSAPWDRNK